MGKSVNRYDFYNVNFENYFKTKIETITDVQKNKLPDDLVYKLYRHKSGAPSELSFNEKVYILSVGFNEEVNIFVGPKEDGMTVSDYVKLRSAKKGEITNTQLLSEPRISAGFVMASKNLFEAKTYLNHIYSTEIYNLVHKFKEINASKQEKKFNRGREAIKSLSRLILNYEMNKKRIVMEFGLTPSELYAILYFSTGEKLGVDFYNNDFKFSYNSNRSEMFRGLKKLHDTGFLAKRGSQLKHKYTITAKGMDLLDKIAQKIAALYKI